MFRKQARIRRDFLHSKSEDRCQNKKNEKSKALASVLLKGNIQTIPSVLPIQSRIKYIDVNRGDDEYKYAGSCNPKLLITTSHNPSAKLKIFVKELRLIFPNAQRMNRGKSDLKQLMRVCCSNDVTDVIVVHEHRGIPDNIVISHLPNGPTAFFNISDVVMRHDVTSVGNISEQNPHLIFHNFKSKIGERTMNVLKYLFPTPKLDSKRVITFANHDDYISFRHHIFKYETKELNLKEIGPRFLLKLYQIKLGKLDELQASDTEWILKPYMNTSVKNKVLSNDNGWDEKDN